MATLTYYTNFHDLKAVAVSKSKEKSDLIKESELKELVELLTSHRHSKDRPIPPLSPKQSDNGR